MKKELKHTIVRFQLAILFLQCLFFLLCFPFLILFFDLIKISNYRDYLVEKIEKKLEESEEHSLW